MNLYERRSSSNPPPARRHQSRRRRKKGRARSSAPKIRFETVVNTGPGGITQKQVNYLRVLGYQGPVKTLSKQGASELIGQHLQAAGKVHTPKTSTALPHDAYLKSARERWRSESNDDTLERLAGNARRRLASMQAEDG